VCCFEVFHPFEIQTPLLLVILRKACGYACGFEESPFVVHHSDYILPGSKKHTPPPAQSTALPLPIGRQAYLSAGRSTYRQAGSQEGSCEINIQKQDFVFRYNPIGG